MLSEMLALKYAANGYSVRYTTSTDAHDVMSALSPNREVCELVVLDDFLGGNLLEVRESQVTAVCSLVHHVRNMPGKRVILNSRISILNEARRRDVSQRMSRGFRNVPIVSTNHLTSLEKARIMIALMRREGVSAECIQSLMGQRIDRPWYRHLVEHRNFNPRIIEFASRSRSTYELAPDAQFASLLATLLDNPSQVWESEFERLTPSDRCLLHTLYTMPRGVCDGERVRAAYERRIAHDPSIDASGDSFSKSLTRLNDSLVRSAVERDGSISLSAANPSINDYIASELKHGDALCLRTIQGAEYLDQVERVTESNQSPLVCDKVRRMASSGQLLEMPTLGRDVHEVALGVLGALELFDREVRTAALRCVDSCLIHRRVGSREPMGYVVRYAQWMESSQDDDGMMGDALCEENRLAQLVRRAAGLDDLGVLTDLYEKVHGPLFGSELKRTFDEAFGSLLYERVADYCMDQMFELADESGMQPYEVDEDEWVFVDDDELGELRAYCVEQLDERVDDILEYADYGCHDAIKRNWSWDNAASLVKIDIESFFKSEDFDFLSEPSSPAALSRTTNTRSEDASIDQLFEDFAESLR